MSLFSKKVQVYGPETVSVGDFDPTVDGCYRNVVTIPLNVKPHRMLYVKVSSDMILFVTWFNDTSSPSSVLKRP